MIERLHRISKALYGLRHIILLLAIGSFCFAAYSLLISESLSDDQALLLTLVLFIWSGLAYTIVQLFQQLPPSVSEEDSYFRRLAIHFKRGLYWLLALSVVMLSLAVVIASYQMLRASFFAY